MVTAIPKADRLLSVFCGRSHEVLIGSRLEVMSYSFSIDVLELEGGQRLDQAESDMERDIKSPRLPHPKE